MEDLKEMVRIISRNKIRRINILGEGHNSNTKIDRLYEAIHSGEVASDNDAITLLYGDLSYKPAYERLKYTFKKKLFNTIFFIDQKALKFSTQYEAEYTITREYLEIITIKQKGGDKLAQKMATKLLLKAERYEKWDIAMLLANFLQGDAAIRDGDFKLVAKYRDQFSFFSKMYHVSSIIESRYYELLAHYVKSKAPKQYLGKIAAEFEEEVNALDIPKWTFRLSYLMNYFPLIKHQSYHNHQEVIDLCKKGLVEAEKRKADDPRPFLTYTGSLATAYLYQRKFKEGNMHINKALAILTQGIMNWFSFKLLQTQLSLHTQQYGSALSMWYKAIRTNGYGQLSEKSQQMWQLYGVWLHLLSEIHEIALPGEIKPRHFRTNSFIRNVENWNKDRSGMSINSLILRLIWLLFLENYSQLQLALMNLDRYMSKYVDINIHFRSNVFLKFFDLVGEGEFYFHRAKQPTKTAFKDLKKKRMELNFEELEIEVLPYEDMVDLVNVILKRNNIDNKIPRKY